ncbi:CRISPR-associated protein [Sulfobacillus thermosulfidooxidans]|uniref:CRISPR-associated protein n=1 Tax=Sulfobacillus thermosulfidooxidans TaxID=28034 RepID=UPI0006B59980|nr:type I CRISPR-associated protein Cas7 [Sulfobacillus thermosulfidooxidans]
MDAVRSGELLFIKTVKDGIPNRDPLADSDARRLFGEDDGRISLSDVSVKRDVRDFVLAKYPDGGDAKDKFVFVHEERTPEGKLLGRGSLVEKIFEQAGITVKDLKSSEEKRRALCEHAYDVRLFGAVYSVSKESFHLTGPVQFGWAHSLHPVETQYVQGTVVMPSKDTTSKEDGSEEGNTQGTIWTTWYLPFAMFAMPAVINATIAKETGMRGDDVELMLEALWKGTLYRQARGRGFQQPQLLVHIEYTDPFFRIGYLDETVRADIGSGTKIPTALQDITLDVTGLNDRISRYMDRIARIRVWKNPDLKMIGTLDAEELSF